MRYEVVIKKKAFQGVRNLPRNALMVLRSLLLDLENGPVQPKYMNYSKLEESKYHCHLAYHWVACWECREGKMIDVGSRESAPYARH